MIAIEIDKGKLSELHKTIHSLGKSIPREMAVAINATARFVKSQIAKEIQATGLNVTQTIIKSKLKSGDRANVAKPRTSVTLRKDFRFGLDAFKASQTKKGVTYRIVKGGGRKRITNAFIPKRYGGKVYVRQAKSRGPLRQMRGVSPWGMFVKNNKTAVVSSLAIAELNKQVQRRIRFLTLKAAGEI